MTASFQNEFDRNRVAAEAEKTLRLIATLPAPKGIETRVKGRLDAAPSRPDVIEWPVSSLDGRGWVRGSGMRAAAAAAIVLIVAGGGWGVYSRIHVAPVPTAVIAPQNPSGTGRFSGAEARRTPQTVVGPAVPAQPALTQKREATKMVPALHRNSRSRAIAPKTTPALPAVQ
jgi:hypothetical protein